MEIAGQVVPVTQLTTEQALQLHQWQQENKDAWWRFCLTLGGALIAIIALIFTGWRTWELHRQAHEQMLASYRERLFSPDPSAVISAAMSLSAYPREAVWLVNRWAQEHKKGSRHQEEKRLRQLRRPIPAEAGHTRCAG